jgi:hypothetical protein
MLAIAAATTTVFWIAEGFEAALPVALLLLPFLLLGWWLVTVAQGDPNDTLSALSAIFGLTFIAAVVFLARRG